MSTHELFDLTGKVALVTGGNSGLGLGFATGMAKCGADIVVWGRRADRNAQAAELLRAAGAPRVWSQTVDVSVEEQVVDGMVAAVDHMGRVDCVVQNAGFATVVPFHEMSTDEYRALVAVAQDGGFWTLREGVRHMVARAETGDPGGSLLLCGSLTQFRGEPMTAHYGAAKSAMQAMMRNVALEYGHLGIRANMVCAGWFHTEMYGAVPKEMFPFNTTIEERLPARRWGEPKDLEGIAAYLASDAASYHTGDVIVVDGGTMLLMP
jgi:NAD(P)-dependent dehydrogenase (short-subunit alcohol dehydrogenase family)